MATEILIRPVNPQSVEDIFRRSKDWAERAVPQLSKAGTGIRIANARSQKFMKTLEKCAEVMDQMAENQRGQVKRQASTSFSEKVDPTVTNLFREAYKAADNGGLEMQTFGYLYGAVAEYAGYII